MTLRRSLLTLILLTVTAVACAEKPEQNLPAPIQALQERGIRIIDTFEAPGGLTGYAGILGRRPIAIYLTEDGKRAIVGSMINGQGEFVNRDILQRIVVEPMSQRVWTQLKNSTWVAEGDPKAPRTVYVFSDPNCPYCYMFWKRAQPWLQSGQAELRHVIVAVIGKTSANKAAAILAADHPQQMLIKHKKRFPEGGIEPMTDIPAEIQSALHANVQLMHRLGLHGTPSVVYRDDQGHVQFLVGVPSPRAMKQIFGPRSTRQDHNINAAAVPDRGGGRR